jgi:hypothetical protein
MGRREQLVSLLGITAPRRLRLAAAVVVLGLVAGVACYIEKTPPMYVESATVMFSLPASQNTPYAYLMFGSSVIMSGEAITQILLSPQAKRKMREAGGTASVNMALVNLYNQEYPDYGVPLATLTAVSPSAADTRRTFAISARLLGHILAARQADAGVPPRDRISAQIIGESGPASATGSAKRVVAGLALLAVVAVSVAWGFLDRRGAGGTRRLTGSRRCRRKAPAGNQGRNARAD